MKLKMNNYETVFERFSEDLNSQVMLLKHKKTGANVFVLSNDDNNKVFYIGFRTPPEDSTGVAHITEHSVLCGSEKYPLKDPFVELAKGSLNTFLNAMTYPDKTVYPVASTNDRDFKNLMSVYMDAVFYPNTYKYPEILKQEGWNYKIENPEDPIEYNGVVYNEMKGVFSSPDGVLEREVLNSLFPDTAYGVESGGDPEYIPDLTYEKFIDFHRTFYHPSNSFIYLYGDMDVEERLAWLDKEYLSAYDAVSVDSEIKLQAPFEGLRRTEKAYPITDGESSAENTYLSYSFVCGDNLDIKKGCALQMIEYALIDMQGAPIRQRLLDEGIGKDVLSGFDDSILQPYFQITVKNSDAGKADRFIDIVNEEFKKAAREGLDRKSLLASLNSLEFKYREADFGGYPKGLIYGLDCLNSWLYDENSPLLYLELGSVYGELRKDLEGDYYEKLIEKYFLGNPHASLVILYPEKGLAAKQEERTARKLADYKASLSDEQINELIAQTKALAEYQEEPSKPEDLAKIPLLERSDIKPTPEKFRNKEVDIAELCGVWHDYSTNGIAYIDIFFDANGVGSELFPYLGLLKSVISYVDTEHYSYTELNNEINTVTGGFGAECGVYQNRMEHDRFSVLADLSVKVLYENVKAAADLADEVLFLGNYRDYKRLYEIIAELKSKLEMSLTSSGHVAAYMRAASYHSMSAALKEQISGIEFYKFIADLERNFDDRKEELAENMEKLLKLLLRADGTLFSVTADKEGLECVKEAFAGFKERLDGFAPEGAAQPEIPVNKRSYDFAGSGFELGQKNEAFITSGSVNYVARCGRYSDGGAQYTGSVNVFHTIMRYEYMWFNIRVQGGAYGCMCGSTASGDDYFVTYRDPNLSRSNDVFEGIPGYLESFTCSEREMTKFVIGTVSSIDTPLTPSAKGARDMSAYITGVEYNEIARIRSEIINCTAEDIRALAPEIRRSLSGGNICCVGCESKIEEDKMLFKEIRNLLD